MEFGLGSVTQLTERHNDSLRDFRSSASNTGLEVESVTLAERDPRNRVIWLEVSPGGGGGGGGTNIETDDALSVSTVPKGAEEPKCSQRHKLRVG